jgi:hypothetical protein
LPPDEVKTNYALIPSAGILTLPYRETPEIARILMHKVLLPI